MHQRAVLWFLWSTDSWKQIVIVSEFFVTEEHFVINTFVQKLIKSKKEEKSVSRDYFTSLQKAKADMEITFLTSEIISPPNNYFWKFLVIAVIDRMWRVTSFEHVEP